MSTNVPELKELEMNLSTDPTTEPDPSGGGGNELTVDPDKEFPDEKV